MSRTTAVMLVGRLASSESKITDSALGFPAKFSGSCAFECGSLALRA